MTPAQNDNQLGNYLKDRRAKLDPGALGIPLNRRRTPGLRREEVAQRANVSATWYTWLEQGRGGAPSADVLERIAKALALNPVEREHLFLLAQHRPPAPRYQSPEPVTPLLQRVLDSMEASPAIVRTALWDVIAWNEAACAVMADYGALAPADRNILKLVFGSARVRAYMVNWERDARAAVAAFRAQATRAGTLETVQSLVDELCGLSHDFDMMWRDDAVDNFGEGIKHFRYEVEGDLRLEYSSFTVDGRPDLGLVIFNPATSMDAARIRMLVEARRGAR